MATAFQKAVWKAISKIPEGRVATYGAIAEYLGTKAVRAVGSAAGKNPYAPEVPCHRVVRADGKVGNYSGEGGRATKIALLRKEGIEIRGDRIVDMERALFDFSHDPQKEDGNESL